MIAPETINEVKSRLDIAEVVSDFVTLKRAGQNFRALSPFTSEKTPSFYVVPSKGIYKDFSSGKGGDAISFVMEHEGMSYPEAIRYLARKYGIQISEDGSEELKAQTLHDGLYILMAHATGYFKDLLSNHQEGRSIGLAYLRDRGFKETIIDKFEVGYSLNQWNHFMESAMKAGYSDEMLEKAGLIVNNEGKKYDRFRGRVIFPVHNLSGKTVAFGARILTSGKDQPKYVNSPETVIYSKKSVLYGLFQARTAIRKEGFCYLTEGYTDVISFHQSGIENIVASSGTSLTEDQIRLLRRFTDNVTILFDGDEAGIRAAIRGIDLLLKGELNIRILLLPQGEDPDSFAKKNSPEVLSKFLKEKSQDFISFKIDLLARQASNDPVKKAQAIHEIINSISVIPDPIKRSVYLQETSHLLKISEIVLLTELNKQLLKAGNGATVPDPQVQKGNGAAPRDQGAKSQIETVIELQERETIRLLLNYAESQLEDQRLVDFMLTELEEVQFTNQIYREIFQVFREATERKELADIYYFMEHGSAELRSMVIELTTTRQEPSKNWSDKYKIFFPQEQELVKDLAMSNVLRLKFRVIQKLIADNLDQMRKATIEHEIEHHVTIHQQLKEAEREIAGILGTVLSK